MDRSEIAEQTPAPQTSPLKLDSVGTADVDVKVVPWQISTKVWQLRVLHFPRPFLIVSSHQSNLPENFNNVREVSTTQRKKGTKSGKAKNKLENPLPGGEGGRRTTSKAGLLSDESHVKVNNHWKSQPPCRISRNAQANKVADRSHGYDATIWAPVRFHHGLEGADEAGRKLEQHSIAVTTKNDSLVCTVNMQEHMENRSIVVQQNHHMGSSSNSSKNIHKFMDQQGSIPEPIVSDAWDPSVGWNMPH
ncbi:hypothetical protein POM88_038710 [Heracleum sosnowskyi]|uniref:Uncharacterized protein n=1 Tax=Heracleum sosnowskyi TaxID=360622 RepID=A0AAD8HB65_9APIA|nr:hypothetical protein POM88_038710 [Heracleum sosnowskyi]